jgi:pyruvyltransferase
MGLIKIFSVGIRFSDDLVSYFLLKKKVPVVFFDGRKNVGDLLNLYFLEKLFGFRCYKPKTNFLPHLRIVGSVLGSASKNSFIFGGGSIDGVFIKRGLKQEKIFALRGKLSLGVVRKVLGDEDFNVPLGDPALLLPLIYKGNKEPVKKSGKIGVVPHFVDKNNFLLSKITDREDVVIIDVESDVEDFVDSILSCDYILSSSLHGLIISDAYRIPNKWIVFSDLIIGGEYKFKDYYSTTSNVDEEPTQADSIQRLDLLLGQLPLVCSVKEYLFNFDDLMKAIRKIPYVHSRFSI